MAENCIFCNIINREANSEIIAETDHVIVIRDIMPKAPVHLQVISKQHIASLNDLTDSDSAIIGQMIWRRRVQLVLLAWRNPVIN